MGNRLLFIDTETGGLDPNKHSLLSIGVVVWDDTEGELFATELYLANKQYNVTKTAAQINHFNEELQRELSIAPMRVVESFIEIKSCFFQEYSAIPLAGHNISFDVQFIKHLFYKCGRSFEKLFSHRLVDTYSIIKYLSDCQLIPDAISSSSSAFKYFGIVVNGRHTALGDARATMQLYSALVALMRKRTGSKE